MSNADRFPWMTADLRGLLRVLSEEEKELRDTHMEEERERIYSELKADIEARRITTEREMQAKLNPRVFVIDFVDSDEPPPDGSHKKITDNPPTTNELVYSLTAATSLLIQVATRFDEVVILLVSLQWFGNVVACDYALPMLRRAQVSMYDAIIPL